jgi:hypothetical protein
MMQYGHFIFSIIAALYSAFSTAISIDYQAIFLISLQYTMKIKTDWQRRVVPKNAWNKSTRSSLFLGYKVEEDHMLYLCSLGFFF